MNRYPKRIKLAGWVKVLGFACCFFATGVVFVSGNPSLAALAALGGGNSSSAGSAAVSLHSSFELRLDRATPLSPMSSISFQLDDGTAEHQDGWGNSYYNFTCAAIWLNRFSPSGLTYPLTLDTIGIPWLDQPSGSLDGRTFKLLVYTDADSDGDPSNAHLIYQSNQTIHVYSPPALDYYPVNIRVASPGDLYIGWEDYWAQSRPHPAMYVAAVDSTSSQLRSYVAANSNNCSPNISNLGANQVLNILDNVPGWYGGNLFVRANGNDSTQPTPTPVATATPIATAAPTATPTPRCPGERFSDVCPSDYFYTSVLYLSNSNIISGYSDGTFRPYNNTTRSQLCKIIVLAEGWPLYSPPTPSFSDVLPDHPFYSFVETAYQHNVISGYADGTFRPYNNVTRGQLSKIIVLAEGWSINTSGGPHFSDVPASDPFYAFVETAFNRGVISGYSDGTFRPGANATRGQICKIMYSAIIQRAPTPTPRATTTPVPSNTVRPTDTASPIPTNTSQPTYTALPTNTSTPSSTYTSTALSTVTATPTSTATGTVVSNR